MADRPEVVCRRRAAEEPTELAAQLETRSLDQYRCAFEQRELDLGCGRRADIVPPIAPIVRRSVTV